MNIDQKFESKYAAKYLNARLLTVSSFQTGSDSIQAIFWNPKTDFPFRIYLIQNVNYCFQNRVRMKNGRRSRDVDGLLLKEVQSDFSSLPSDRSRENTAREEKNCRVSSCLVDKHANKTIWGETRIQSLSEDVKKDAKDKASINFPAFLQTQTRVLTASRSSGQRLKGSHPRLFHDAHFVPNASCGRNGRRTRIRNIWHRIESLMYCCTPREGASGLGVPPSAVGVLGNSPLTASSRQHCSVCSARERERWICTRANSGISPPT